MNGQFLPEEQAQVSLYDSAMMYGDHVFEMTRSFNKEPFRLYEHLDRLRDSCALTGLVFPYELEELQGIHARLLDANALAFDTEEEFRTTITVSRGPLPLYRHLTPRPWVMMTAYPLSWVVRSALPTPYERGVACRIVTQQQVPPAAMPARVKHHSRLHFRLAEVEVARIEPGAIPILLTANGCVTETPGANIIVRFGNELHTPATGCLQGISQRFAYELARQHDFVTVTGVTHAIELEHADEILLTNTPWCVLPVTSLNGQPLGDGRPGRAFKILTAAWSVAVRDDYVTRQRAWSERG